MTRPAHIVLPVAILVLCAIGCAEPVEILVPEMMCEQSCVPAVRESLAARPGVKQVQVDLETKTALVYVDAAVFDADAAVADLLDLGFKGTHVAGEEPPQSASADAAAIGESGGDSGTADDAAEVEQLDDAAATTEPELVPPTN